jgi:predicted Zn finger-like uncharacterized protein
MHKLVAQCPSCQARYNVTQGQLKVADGRVRCGQCLTVFHALKTTSRTNADHTAEKTKTPSPPATRKLQPEKLKPKTDPLTLLRQMPPDPPELSPASSQPAASQKLAIAGSFMALVLLAGQYLWFERARLAQEPSLLPFYATLCEQLDCTLPSYQGLKWLQTSHLIVRSQTEQPDTLEVITGLINSGPLPVHLPVMRLHFTNASGRIIAANDFPPDSYLPGSNTRQLQPGQQRDIQLFIQRPAAGYLGYELDWLPLAAH